MSGSGADDLTERQLEVYQTIARLWLQKGSCPTTRELMDAIGVRSPNGVVCHLKYLEQKGYIYRAEKQARMLKLTGVSLTLVPDRSECGQRAARLLQGVVK